MVAPTSVSLTLSLRGPCSVAWALAAARALCDYRVCTIVILLHDLTEITDL